MSTPRLLLFGLFLPLTLILLICQRTGFLPGSILFWESGFTWQSWIHSCLEAADFFFAVVNRYNHGFTLECHLLPTYFLSPAAPPRTDYCQSGGDKKKMHFNMVNSFPKRLSRNQSINQFIYVNTWDGVAPIIRAKGYHGSSLPSPFL